MPEPGQVHQTGIPADGQRLLFITTKHTGNNVFCTPAIRFTRHHFPNSRIDVVALNKLSAEVFESHPDINRVFVSNRPWVVTRLCQRYDRVICLNNKSAHLIKHVNQPCAIAPRFPDKQHHADATLDFVAETLDIPGADEFRNYALDTSATPPAVYRSILKNRPTSAKAPIIGIHLGCGRTAVHGWKFFHAGRGKHQKLWPVENYIDLARQFKRRFPGCQLVITGTRNEAFLARQFQREITDSISLIGKTTARTLLSTISNMNLFVSHDCGVLHIASATNTPLVALFAATHVEQTGPYSNGTDQVVIKRKSMSDITPAEVVEQSARFISVRPRVKPALFIDTLKTGNHSSATSNQLNPTAI